VTTGGVWSKQGVWERSARRQDYAAPVLERGPRADGKPRFTPGASKDATDTKTVQFVFDRSTTRATILTPSAGKKIRLQRVECLGDVSVTGSAMEEMFFGTGANITTAGNTPVAYYAVNANSGFARTFGKADGPVGTKDQVLSIRANVDTPGNTLGVIEYVEER